MANPVAVSQGDAVVQFGAAGGSQPDIVVRVDPMTTVLTSIVELFGPLSYRLPATTRVAAPSADPDASVPALRRLLGDGLTCPDFFTDQTPTSSFDEQVERIREMPLDIVEQDLASSWELGGVAAQRWRREPERCLADWCQTLTTYRRTVIDTLYPKLEQRLQREAARLEVGLAEYGHADLLNLMHPLLRVQSDSLRLSRGHKTGTNQWQPDLFELRPMMCFAEATYHTNIGSADNPRIRTAFFATAPPLLRSGWQSRGTPGDSGLDLLIGQPKTEVLRSLRRRPGTTTDLADELGLAPSTVSFHLKVLSSAGAITGSRGAGGVYYRLTDRGQRLLDC